jgi:prolyl-tRNA synthetase
MQENRITKRDSDFSRWYNDVIEAAELADYSPVKGCMIIRPNGYAIWEKMQAVLDRMFKETGHENAYFPLFIPEEFLKREAKHVAGFAPELAVVTHAGGQELLTPLVVRPTSETIIWHSFRKWIHSYRDLPILINQWANVVRWELRTKLFLRTTEFLWQEGHTAHATFDDAEEEARRMLEVYRSFLEDTLAIPVIAGRKTELEKFAGAEHTYSIEALMQDGKALQAGTSHHLGQNFARAFDVTFQSITGTQEYVYATSWGVSTRLIGALVMTHGDDLGIVIPPLVAATKVVIVPIGRGDGARLVIEYAEALRAALSDVGVKLDRREEQTPGWKFNYWERRGVPIRLEVGSREVANGTATAVCRYSGERIVVSRSTVRQEIAALLATIQNAMLERARHRQLAQTHRVDAYETFRDMISANAGLLWTHWCGASECEQRIKLETKATIRCIPLESQTEQGKCIACSGSASQRFPFAKAY